MNITNFRILENFFSNNGYSPELLDLCFDDDKSIGLEMPKTWYLNKGKHALSIAMYYNYLNFHGIVEKNNLDTFNKEITSQYGRIACIEIYLENELRSFLNQNNIKYFGTPKTLTECVRYLEGWSIEKYPRLKGYVTFSKFIELWSRINFPSFNAEEWYLGKEISSRINHNRATNVRSAVKYFWENYLSRKQNVISEEDVEIDILGGLSFHKKRKPQIILMSEDLFSNKNSDFEIFKNLTQKTHKDKMYISRLKNDFPIKNAQVARDIFPDSLVVLIENDSIFDRNFSLINPIKQSINTDVVVTAKILRHVIENHI